MIGDGNNDDEGIEPIDQKAVDLLEKAKNKVDSLAESIGAAGDAAESFLGMFGGFDLSISSIVQFALEVDQARADVSKLTGGMADLSSQVAATRGEVQGLAFLTADLYETVGQANTVIAEFSELNKDVQGKVAGTIASLTKLGVSSDTTAKNINDLSKGLGIGSEEAAKITQDLAKVGMQLGSFMTPGKIAEEFSASLPKLAAYGKGAVREFSKLAATAKVTGMEIQSLLGIAGQFDTFEDAANNTAQLNALLGTQLNSVDMLTASESERLEMLKANFDATGRQFDQLDRFEKKALAQAAGFDDINEAAKFFGASLEDINDAQEEADPALVAQNEFNKALQRGVSTTEQFAAMMEKFKAQLAATIMPIIMDFFRYLTTPIDGVSPLQQAVNYIEQFAIVVRDDLIVPLSEWFRSFDKESQGFIAKIVAIMIALKPISGVLALGFGVVTKVISTIISGSGLALTILMKTGSILMTLTSFFAQIAFFILKWGAIAAFKVGVFAVKVALFAIFKIVGAVFGILMSLVGWPLLIIAGLVLLYKYFEPFRTIVDDYILNPLAEAFDGISIKLSEWVNSAIAKFYELKESVMEPLREIGNFFIDMLNSYVIEPFASLINGLADNIPEGILNRLGTSKKELYDLAPKEAIQRLHEGGDLVGPAIIRDDEYLMIPPKNAPTGNVMTPKQMKQAGGDQPVTVVINIDGREFVKKTVMPALNKEFKLQGIG